MHNTKFWALFIISAVLVATLCLSPASTSLMNSVIVRSSGEISTELPTITAASGYWRDIQAAVNWVVAHGGVGNVYIPEGTWNFINPGDSWSAGTTGKVVVPAGVSIFGAPTERDENGQVTEWKTILQIPAEFSPARPDYCLMFRFQGSGDPNKPSRFSDIKVVGYREFEPTSDRWYGVLRIWNIINFRVDHCFFNNTAGTAVDVRAPADGNCCGVIDHCKFINNWGYVEWAYDQCTVHYGIMIRAVGTTRWEDDITKVIGQYTGYTVFIEDCYFSRWRHCVSSNDGVHYVFRRNTVEKDSITGSVDAHGSFDYVGTRAVEVYNNILIDPISNHHPENWNNTTPTNGDEGYGLNWRGGGGVFFNNLVRGYEVGVYLMLEGTDPKYQTHDAYIWNNTFTNLKYNILAHSGINQNEDYFLYAKPGYTPHPYPHPLTLEKP